MAHCDGPGTKRRNEVHTTGTCKVLYKMSQEHLRNSLLKLGRCPLHEKIFPQKVDWYGMLTSILAVKMYP